MWLGNSFLATNSFSLSTSQLCFISADSILGSPLAMVLKGEKEKSVSRTSRKSLWSLLLRNPWIKLHPQEGRESQNEGCKWDKAGYSSQHRFFAWATGWNDGAFYWHGEDSRKKVWELGTVKDQEFILDGLMWNACEVSKWTYQVGSWIYESNLGESFGLEI